MLLNTSIFLNLFKIVFSKLINFIKLVFLYIHFFAKLRQLIIIRYYFYNRIKLFFILKQK